MSRRYPSCRDPGQVIYDHDDANWRRHVRHCDSRLLKLERALAEGGPIDKWGNPLKVGDRVKHRLGVEGVIASFDGQVIVEATGRRWLWSDVEAQ